MVNNLAGRAYGQAFKNRTVARLLPQESATLEVVARETAMGTATLERWRAEELSKPARERGWTAAARFDAVLTTAVMDEAAKSAWCRANGLYPLQLTTWQQSATPLVPSLPYPGPLQPGNRRLGGARTATTLNTPLCPFSQASPRTMCKVKFHTERHRAVRARAEAHF